MEFRDVEAGASDSILISGSDCYTCWYFIKIVVTDPRKTSYRLTVQQDEPLTNDVHSLYPISTTIGPTPLYVAASRPVNRKFILDSMDHWLLEAQVAMGAVDVYVGLDPAKVGPQDYIWKASSDGGVASLAIKTTDVSFHLATYYYISIYAVSGADALIKLSLKQHRSVAFIPNNHDYTFSLTQPSWDKALLY
jgi:hypothetical protein